jgi:hypothetical protein
MKTNEGPVGRIVRGTTGAILMGIAVFSLESPFALLEAAIAVPIAVLGGITFLTGLIGWCPAYALLGIDNCPDAS